MRACSTLHELRSEITALLTASQVVGVTVVLIAASYRGKEFVRVGYYVSNDEVFQDDDPHQDGGDAAAAASPHDMPMGSDDADGLGAPHSARRVVQRTILADAPRVTRFPIDWTPRPAWYRDDRNTDSAMDDDDDDADFPTPAPSPPPMWRPEAATSPSPHAGW